MSLRTTPGKGAVRTGLASVLLLLATAAQGEPVVVDSFRFSYSPGRTVEFDDIKETMPGLEAAAELKRHYPEVENVRLYCTTSTGPRFAHIDGEFYKLNQKSRRQGAYVVTSNGREKLLDIEEQPSPLAGDFLLILNLVRDAGKGC